jgi:transposase-like protein
MGADASGKKELVGLWDGYRESEQSWKELLLGLRNFWFHGLSRPG